VGRKERNAGGDRLDVLVALIEVYEAKHYPIDPPDPIEAFKFRMEQQGLSA
jgi:HTH-type transcriptional regulator/antitoxin HigA